MSFTAVAFVTLFTLGWLADLAFDSLNSVHPFRPEVQAFMGKLGLWLTYLDATLCGIVLMGGIIRFVLEL